MGDSRSGRGAVAVRRVAVASIVGGALAALAATFLPVLRVAVDGAVRPALDSSGWDLHGPALVALALLALLALPAAARGSVLAAGLIGICGLVIVAIVLLGDLPDAGERGLVGERLVEGVARAGAGAYAEALAGVLLVAGGGVLAFLGSEG